MDTPADDTPRKPGRPSAFTQELAQVILERLASGESLRAICSGDDMPDRSSVMRWLAVHSDFKAAYTTARELGCEALADEVLGLAMEPMAAEHATVVRVRLDAIKWFSSKIAPKRFGDRVQAELTGSGGGAIELRAVPSERLTPPQVAASVKALLTQAEVSAGLPNGSDRPDAERLQAILASDQPLDPALYSALGEPEDTADE
jgi:hypothetical protein